MLLYLLLFFIICVPVSDYDYSIPRYPSSRLLPQIPKNFVGRHNELKKLKTYLDYENTSPFTRIIGIFGSPGFGKSALARLHI